LRAKKLFTWLLFFLLLCFVPNGLFVDNSAVAAFYDTNWNYYRECYIDSSKIDNTLGNFPVLIVIPSNVSSVADGGNSLRFFDENMNPFNYEIELWNVSGDSFIWVNVTSVNSLSNTLFYMFYNNSAASDNQNPTGVWDINYSMVLHMNGSSYNTINDSTSNNNDIIGEYGSPVYQCEEGVGYSIRFDSGSSEYLVGSTNFSISQTNATVEVYSKVVDSIGVVMDTGVSDSDRAGFKVHGDDERYSVAIADRSSNDRWNTNWVVAPSGNTWDYVSISAGGTNGFYRVNTLTGNAGVVNTPITKDAQNYSIASEYDGNNYFNGLIDEIRISNISRNASWLKASYYSVIDDLVSIGGQMFQNNMTINNTIPVNGETDVAVGNYTHSVDVNETLGHTMNITWRWSGDNINWYSFGSNTSISNGTYTMDNDDNYTSYNHTYYWNVTVDDGYTTIGTLYSFRTTDDVVGDPSGVSTNYLNNELGFNWTLGYRNDRVILVSNNDSYATSVGQTGSVIVYNGSGTSCIETGLASSQYYTLFGYNSTDALYSSGVQVSWGGMSINVFDEETLAALVFDVFITNQQGTSTYYQEHMSNTLYLNIDDLPQGDNVAIHISANTSYNVMSEYFDGYRRDGLTRQNSTTTYIQLAKMPLNKTSTTVTCVNTSGNSICTPVFILVDNIITIYPDAADEFDSIYVNYSYTQYRSRTYYFDIDTNTYYTLNAYLASSEITNLYLLTVLGVQGEYSSPPLSDVSISIRRYLGGMFRNISILTSDANGQVEVYLTPGILYKCILVKSGYETAYPNYIPSDSIFTHTFRLSPSITPPVYYDSFWGNVTFSIVMDNPGYLLGSNITITYIDVNSSTINTELFLYDTYSRTLIGSVSHTSNSFVYNFSGINNTRSYYVILYFNNTANFDISSPVTLTVFNQWIYGRGTFSLEDRIVSMVGPFKTDYIDIQWAAIISVIISFVLLVSFGVANVGLGIVAAGLGLALSQGIFSMHFTDVMSPLLVGAAAVCIFIGIFYMWAKNRAGENL